jgi:hypothetical protein
MNEHMSAGLAQRGERDGVSGAQPASESMEYGANYMRGRALARVEVGDCFLVVGAAARCPCCAGVLFGEVVVCGCSEGAPVAMERGVVVLEGQNPLGQGPLFWSHGEARQKIAMGLAALDINGHDVSCTIQLTQ